MTGRLLRTETRYDADSNPVDVCRPRQFEAAAQGGGGTPADGCPTEPKYGTRTDYAASGKPLGAVTWRDGTTRLVTTTAYDPDGNTTAATDPNGARSTAEFDLLGRRTSSSTLRTATVGNTTRWMYSPSGDMIATFAPGDAPADPSAAGGDNPAGRAGTRPDGSTFDGRRWRITGTSYDANHRPVDTVKALAVASEDPPNDRVAVVRALTSTGLTDEGKQTNLRTRVRYDPDGRVDAAWSPRAFVTLGTVDGQPSLDRPDGRFLLRTVHDRDGRPTAQYAPRTGDGLTDPTGNASQQTQCAKAAPAPEFGAPAHPAGTGLCETELGYDQADNVTTVRLPTRGQSDGRRILSYAWTSDNLLASVTGPDPSQPTGTVVTLANEYDGTGRTVRAVDANGNGSATTYTADGLVRRTAGSLGANGLKHVQSYNYDSDGNRTCAATLAQADADTTGCGAGSPVTLTRTVWTNDGKPAEQTEGRVQATDPSKSVQTTTRWTYDANGNAREVLSPSAVAKDATNPGGIPTVNTYTRDNLLDSVTVPVLTEANRATAVQSRVTRYAYDPAGRKTAASVALTGQGAADAGTQSFSYYPSDQLRAQTGRPQNGTTVGITNAYDAAGSMTGTTDRRLDGSTHTVTASYYADQLLRDVADGVRRTGYAYDGAGALTARAEGPAAGPASRTEDTVRNDAGLPAGSENPLEGSGASAEWVYDPAGRLKTEKRVLPRTGAAPVVRTQEFVRAGDDLLTGTTVRAGDGTSAPTLASWQYTHDNAGRILTQAFSGQAAATSVGGAAGQPVPDTAPVTYRFDYDHAGRLSSFADARGRRTVRFDADGNRTVYGQAAEPDPKAFSYRADDTIATETTGTGLTAATRQYSYLPFGGLSDDGCTGYGYDGLDRLTQAAARASTACGTALASTTDYRYDGLDRQVQRTANGPVPNAATQAVTRLSYDGWGQQSTQQSAVVGGDAATARTLAYGLRPDGTVMTASAAGGDPLAPTGAEQLAEDGTGSTGLITSPDSTVRCTARYDAYGSPDGNTTTAAPAGSCNTGQAASEMFYRGNRKDMATGQYQLGSRTYDPAKAAFLTPDAYRTEGSAANTGVGVDPLTRNSYTYVNGDPINYADPNGHEPRAIHSRKAGACADGRCSAEVAGYEGGSSRTFESDMAVAKRRAPRAFGQNQDAWFDQLGQPLSHCRGGGAQRTCTASLADLPEPGLATLGR